MRPTCMNMYIRVDNKLVPAEGVFGRLSPRPGSGDSGVAVKSFLTGLDPQTNYIIG